MIDARSHSVLPLGRSVLGYVLTSALVMGSCGQALADDASVVPAMGAAMPGAAVPSALASGAAPVNGIPFGSWMLYPSLFVGAVFDDNVYRVSAPRVSRAGLRLAPNVEADLDEGVHKATVYGALDARLYQGYSSALGQNASTLQARVGFAHMWSPAEDIVTRFSFDYARIAGPFGLTAATGASINSATSFVGAATALNVSGFRQFANQTTGSVYLQKTISDNFFVRVGGGLQDLVYEKAPIGYTGGLSGYDGSTFMRIGAPVTPQLTAFVEGGGDFRRYYASPFYDTNAFRVIAGLSSDLVGLFKGEAYGGIQRQFSVQGTFAPLTAPAAGGRLTYYPTEYFTLAASADMSFGAAGGAGFGSIVSARNETLQTRLQADYALHQYWRASARAGYAQTWYNGSNATASTWLTGAGLSYFFWTNWAVTADYQYTRVLANAIGSSSYVDNLASLGVTYRY